MRKRKEREFAIPKSYIVPPAVLCVAHGCGSDFGSPPSKDETFPIPDDWMRANARRYFFTDEEILSAAVTEFSAPNLHEYARCYGVYFLISENEIVYVGLSTDIETRIKTHQKNGRCFNSFAWFEAPELYLRDIEAYYIDRIQPILNEDYPGGSYFGEIAKSFEYPGVRKARKQFILIVSPTR